MKGTGRGRRHLTDEERTLWAGVTRSLKPLARRASARAAAAAAAALEEPAPAKPEGTKATKAAERGRAAKAPPRTVAKSVKPVPPPSPPPLAPLGRRTKQRIARGTQAIDARIDLHGFTQAQAHDALLRFLRRAQADGARIVLVITGKGVAGRDPFGERGVLRRQVPMWLKLPEFRTHIVSVEAATIGHGGEGALYVRLRRLRD